MKKKYSLTVVFVAIFAVTSFSQVVLQGTVRSATEPIIAASVYVRGTSNGTVTDIDGKFSLTIPQTPSDSAKLVISAIGYKTVTQVIGTRTQFNITLEEDTELLSEVVVTGYTAQKKEMVTGAVNTVTAEVISKLPLPSIDQALQGRAPGVVVTQNTGAPGEGVSVRIRGSGSLNSSNSPLYVVDGVPTTDINSISTQDVENISILKDAGATAIYGSRAANGVVIVTTKRGSSSAPRIEISSQVGVQNISRKLDMATTDQYVSIYNEAANADNATKDPLLARPLITDAIKSNLANVNYMDAILRNGVLQSHSLAVSGGDDKTRYYFSGNYFSQEGIIKASDYDRISVRANVDTQIKKWIKSGVALNITRSTTNLIGSSGDGAGGNGGSAIRYALFRTPAIPIFDSPGVYSDRPTLSTQFGDGYNPVAMLAYNNNKVIADRVFGRGFIELSPFEGFKFTSSVGVDVTNSSQRRFDRNYGTANRINNPNLLTATYRQSQSVTISNFATYTRSFGSHNLNILAGTEAIKARNYVLVASEKDYADQSNSLVYLGLGRGARSNDEANVTNALLSYFGKVSYDYQGKYLATATIRRDGSSRFGPDNRWGTFYAGSAGWRLDKEAFLVNNNAIDLLLLRVGYGQIGNQDIRDYAYVDGISPGYDYPFNNTRNIGYAVTNFGNSQLKWETSKQLNIGVDVELFNGKVTGSLDYFTKTTSDLLVQQSIASSAGETEAGLARSVYINNGEVLNRGFELAIGYSNNAGAFSYSVNANAATLYNEVTSLNSPIASGAIGGTNITSTQVGHPIGSFYILEMEGIFQNNTQIFAHALQPYGTIKPGDVMYKDQDGNGIIDQRDRIFAGSPIPKVTAGLTINLKYKNWDLSAFFQGAYGQKIFSVLNRDIEGFYRSFNVTERYFLNHWTGEGSTNVYPRASWDASNNNTQYSTRFLEDGSYTRLKNVQIGYTFPQGMLSRYGLNSLRVFFSGTNLLTLTGYQGLDPEMTVSNNAQGAGDISAGMDWGTYPAARSYNIGINLTF